MFFDGLLNSASQMISGAVGSIAGATANPSTFMQGVPSQIAGSLPLDGATGAMAPMISPLTAILSGTPHQEDAAVSDEAREQAMAALSGKFRITQNEADAGQNVVTQEQFDQIVELYSNISTGNSNIKLDGGELEGEELEEFRSKTMEDIARIMQTDSGRELLADLSTATDKKGKALTTTIGSAGGNSPETEALNEAASKNKRGSSTTIDYNPGESTRMPIDGGSWDPEIRSDVTLYHELCHAHHMTNGEVAVSLDKDGNDTHLQEELNAVGMGDGFDGNASGPTGMHAAERFKYFENRYRRERREIAMSGYSDGVVYGDRTMGQRDNFKGGEGSIGDYATPYPWLPAYRPPDPDDIYRFDPERPTMPIMF